MALRHILGVDHVLVAVRDLPGAAQAWASLGFTVSPLGLHSRLLGSANHTIMFGEDYVELLGIVAETEQNRPTREFLLSREGVERVAFTTDDAAEGAAEIAARGFAPLGPIHFGRPVPLPGGGETEARFNVFRWPLEERPGGTRIFACQHLTREAVWLPELQEHANAAVGLARIEILAGDPAAAAAHLSRLIDEPARQDGDGWLVPSGGRRADFLFYDAAAFARRYPETVRDGSGPEGAVALAVATADLERAIAASGAVRHDAVASVPAARATGVILSFVAA